MKNKIKKIFIGIFSGLASGLFSSGGGLVLIPLYMFLFKSSEKQAKSTSVFCVLPMVLTSSIVYGFNNYINWHIAFLCSIGEIVGAFIGTKLLNILNPIYLKIIFILFLFYSGFKTIFF